jgi:hypothetical protein
LAQRIRINEKTNLLYGTLLRKQANNDIYLVVIHPWGYRPGEPATILGMNVADVDNCNAPRLCFLVQYEDGKVQNLPVDEKTCYSFIDGNDVRAGRMPQLTSTKNVNICPP